MKILICHQHALAPHHAGVTRHFMLARALVLRGHEVTIVAAATSHKNPEACKLNDGESGRFETYDGVQFLWLRTPSPTSSKVGRVLNMISFAKALLATPFLKKKKIDIVIGNSPDPFTATASAILARRNGAAFVLHMGDIWPQSLIDIGGLSRWHPFIVLLSLMERYLYKTARLIVTPLPHAGTHVADRGGRADLVKCVPIVIDFTQTKQTELPENDVFTFMFAGSHGAGNGVDGIVRAVYAFERKYPQHPFKVRLVGEGALKRDILDLAEQLNIRSLSFEDAVTKENVFALLAQADAFIVNIPDMPIFRTSGISPNKVFDFMAACRPVVIGCSALNNPVVEAGAGYAAPADMPEALADEMYKMITASAQTRADMAARGRAYVEKNNDVRIVGRQLENLLCDLIGIAQQNEVRTVA